MVAVNLYWLIIFFMPKHKELVSAYKAISPACWVSSSVLWDFTETDWHSINHSCFSNNNIQTSLKTDRGRKRDKKLISVTVNKREFWATSLQTTTVGVSSQQKWGRGRTISLRLPSVFLPNAAWSSSGEDCVYNLVVWALAWTIDIKTPRALSVPLLMGIK